MNDNNKIIFMMNGKISNFCLFNVFILCNNEADKLNFKF